MKQFNQRYRLNLTTIDRFCLNVILVLIINPTICLDGVYPELSCLGV